MDTSGPGMGPSDPGAAEGTSSPLRASHITPPADTAALALTPTEEMLARIAAAFPGWGTWEGVRGTGWYARRPRSSPPMVAGPVPLEDLAEAIDAVLASRRRP